MKLLRKLTFSFILLITGCIHNIKPTPAQINARMSIHNMDGHEMVFYFTKPAKNRFPIAVICEGSTMSDDIESVWQLTQFDQFAVLKDTLGILAVEKDGVDAGKIDKDRFFANYTRSKRFHDHVAVIDHLLKNPPDGFNGRLIFIGASEGGPLANQLSIHTLKPLPPSIGLEPMIGPVLAFHNRILSKTSFLAHEARLKLINA